MTQQYTGRNNITISMPEGGSVPIVSQTEIESMKTALSLMLAPQHDDGAHRAAARAEAAGAGRLVPARLYRERLILHAVARRCGRHRQAAERQLPVGMDCVGLLLLAKWTRAVRLSKIEAGKLELNPQSLQLAPLIDEVVDTARQLGEQNKNRLVVETQENLGALTVDPMRLRQMLLNLFSNACKFTKQGHVTLRARRVLADGRNWIDLAVADTGIGMTAE